ncbi:flagellar biosynthetic protein FliQ [Parasphingorhabdus litoris]|uniref:Flagellar biosynthetic protein FliQ n=1 Tax=Parasphingorhabdus litoris TaxID=394733 RepID=A0ABN1A411_9SPHN|nr:flagellar biosynthesis protein FliQ [Parasphingorhabdus litoris]
MTDNADFFVGVAQQALWVTALAAAPLLIPALLVGLLLGMVQAATSINEQTLSFVPKLVVVAVMAAVFGGSILVLIVDFTREIFARIPDLLL